MNDQETRYLDPDAVAASRKCRAMIAVVVHIHYRDLWSELSEAIANIAEPFDLFVTISDGPARGIIQTIRESWPSANIAMVENRGRDILPFLSLLWSGELFRYELICKLHTKRSPYHPDGEAWRKELVGGVLGTPSRVSSLLNAFRMNADLGIVVADGHLYSGREHWESNRSHLMRLLALLGIDESVFDKGFAGGSIYWIRTALLGPVADLPLSRDDFEPEPLAADGGLPHAIERLIGLACHEAGMAILETNAALALTFIGAPGARIDGNSYGTERVDLERLIARASVAEQARVEAVRLAVDAMRW